MKDHFESRRVPKDFPAADKGSLQMKVSDELVDWLVMLAVAGALGFGLYVSIHGLG